MREIKFRALSFNSMVYPNGNITSGDILKRFSTVMQYTGLKDKNGKEIYEGDIIEMSNKKPTAVIEYDYCSFCFRWIDKHYINTRKQLDPIFLNVHLFTVVGNIHENPELLTS